MAHVSHVVVTIACKFFQLHALRSSEIHFSPRIMADCPNYEVRVQGFILALSEKLEPFPQNLLNHWHGKGLSTGCPVPIDASQNLHCC